MLAKVLSGALVGLDGVLVEVEVDIQGQGLPSFTMVGSQPHNSSFKLTYKPNRLG